MTTLLLRFAGPMQGWDVQRRRATPGVGDTHAAKGNGIPTGSAIVGLLGAALGRRRGSDMSDLSALDMVVRCDQLGHLRPEFRTMPARISGGRIVTRPLVDSIRHDARFLVGVQGPDALVDTVAAALRSPVYDLFLGRREFPPTPPLILGTDDAPVEECLRRHEWIAHPRYRRSEANPARLQMFRVRVRQRSDPAAMVELSPAFVENPGGYGYDWLAVLEDEAR